LILLRTRRFAPMSSDEISLESRVKPKYNLAFLYLVKNIGDLNLINPNIFLKAGGEVLAVTIIVSSIITYIVHPEFFENNPLKDRLGYNNACVGWDTAPAVYFAFPATLCATALVLQFCYYDYVRTVKLDRELPGCVGFITNWSNFIWAVFMILFNLVFLISPEQNVYAHTTFFVLFIVGRWLTIFGIFLEFPKEFQTKEKIFMVVYTITSVSLPFIYFGEYLYYDKHGVKSPFPWWITFTLDWLWFFCLFLTSKLLPDSVFVRLTVTPVRVHDLENLPESEPLVA